MRHRYNGLNPSYLRSKSIYSLFNIIPRRNGTAFKGLWLKRLILAQLHQLGIKNSSISIK